MIITINIITIIVTVLKIFLVKVNNFKAFLQVLFLFPVFLLHRYVLFLAKHKGRVQENMEPKVHAKKVFLFAGSFCS